MMKLMRQKGLAPLVIVLLVAIIIAVGAGAYYAGRQQNSGNGGVKFTGPAESVPTTSASATPATSTMPEASTASDIWKTYINSQYGFTLQIPKQGVRETASGLDIGECGLNIKTYQDSSDASVDIENRIAIDNIAYIVVEPWQGSIADYIKKYDPNGIRTAPVNNKANADEALAITGIKEGVVYEGYPPFAYAQTIYKKGGKLFIFSGTQNPVAGCFAKIDFVGKDQIEQAHINQDQYQLLINNYRNYDPVLAFKFTH